jgi:DNA-binding GntR family transcriptional regulator
MSKKGALRLVRNSINEQLYDIIKEKILLTELSLGEQINLKALAGEFNVSTIPVRDALFRLINEGLVVNRSRVGFFVRSFTSEEISDIMEVRQLYEVYCLGEYFDNIDQKRVARCLDRCDKLESSSRRDFDELDEEIHDLLINASRNKCLMKGYKEVKNQIIIFRHLDKDRIAVANQEHKCLLQAILNGDKDEAIRVLRRHIERVASSIL